MKFDLFNKNTQIYPLEIESMFWKKFSVIVEYVKKKAFYAIDIKMDNWFFSKSISSSKIWLNKRGEILLKLENTYWTKQKTKLNLSQDNFDSDLEIATYELTKSIQFHFLKMELENLMDFFKDNWLKAWYTTEKNWPNLEFEIFNIDDPIRRVTFYIEDWRIQYYFEDIRMSHTDIRKLLSQVEPLNYKIVENWLRSESLV